MSECGICQAPVQHDEKGLPVSRYWKGDQKTHNIIMVFCGPGCGLKHYQDNKEEKI